LGQALGKFIEFVIHTFPFVLFVVCLTRVFTDDADALATGLGTRHSEYMAANTLSVSPPEAPDMTRGVAKRLARHLKAQAEDWYDVCRHLSDWEDRHLVDRPTPEGLAAHARLLDDLEQVGRWLAGATQDPDFPDRTTAELVAMTLQDLKDRRALWHGQMSEEEREEFLKSVFHEP
jgi:hypothetical protein